MLETHNLWLSISNGMRDSLAPILRDTAYLDPGSGSYLLQILVASLLGAAVAIRMSWGRIRAFFSRSQTEENIEQDEESSE
jgi:hypothetical protein